MAQTFQNLELDELELVKTQFQVTDCAGANVGTPQDALKTTVLNTVQSKLCNTTDITDPIVTAINNVLAEQDKETTVTTPQIACVDNDGVKTTVYTRTKFIYDSETAAFVSETPEYSTNGVTGWTTTAPTGTITLGACPVTAVVYNVNEATVITGTATSTFAANTYHSVSVAVLAGTAIITVNGVAYTVKAGYSNMWEADTLLTNPIVVAGGTATSNIVVQTIKP